MMLLLLKYFQNIKKLYNEKLNEFLEAEKEASEIEYEPETWEDIQLMDDEGNIVNARDIMSDEEFEQLRQELLQNEQDSAEYEKICEKLSALLPKAEFTSENKAYTISKLPVGEYILHEVKAPKGYNLAEDVKVVIEETGKVQEFSIYDVEKTNNVPILINKLVK